MTASGQSKQSNQFQIQVEGQGPILIGSVPPKTCVDGQQCEQGENIMQLITNG